MNPYQQGEAAAIDSRPIGRLIAALTTPAALKVLWAAMCAMTQDVHSPQDNLSPEEWAVADRIFAKLNGVQNGE